MSLTKVKLCNLALSKIGNERNQLTDPTFSNNTGSVFTQCDLHYDQALNELVRLHTWNCCKTRTQIGTNEITIVIPASVSDSGNEETYTLSASSVDSTNRPVFTNSTSGNADYVSLTFNTTSKTQWILVFGASSTTVTNDVTTYNPPLTFSNGVTVSLVKPIYGYEYQFKLPSDVIRTISVSPTNSIYYYSKPLVEWHVEKDILLTNNQKAFICYDKAPEPTEMDSLFAQAFYTWLAYKLAIPVAGNEKRANDILDEFTSAVMPEARRVNGFEQYNFATNDSEWLEATQTTASSVNSYPPFAQTDYNTIP